MNHADLCGCRGLDKPGLVGLSLASPLLPAAPACSPEPKSRPAPSRGASHVVSFRDGLKDTDEDVREAVLHALAGIGSAEAERVLRRALEDSGEDVRDAAAAALAKQTWPMRASDKGLAEGRDGSARNPAVPRRSCYSNP